jgi:hypothetical protein
MNAKANTPIRSVVRKLDGATATYVTIGGWRLDLHHDERE